MNGDKRVMIGKSDKKKMAGGTAHNQMESSGSTARGRPVTDNDADLGSALRSAYQQTVEEDIPAEMLDLLKRLS